MGVVVVAAAVPAVAVVAVVSEPNATCFHVLKEEERGRFRILEAFVWGTNVERTPLKGWVAIGEEYARRRGETDRRYAFYAASWFCCLFLNFEDHFKPKLSASTGPGPTTCRALPL